jgi:hypothetical protein
MREADQLHARRQQRIQRTEIQRTVRCERDELQCQAALLRQNEPGHQIGVMLQLTQHDRVAGLQERPSIGIGEQVQRLGRVAREDDLLG